MARNKPETVEIDGINNTELKDKIFRTKSKNLSIKINSIGGQTAAGLEIGKFLISKNVTTEVNYVCFSACASFILTSSNKIQFTNKPLIGFHWSPMLDLNQYQRYGGDITLCPSSIEWYEIEKNIFDSRRLNHKFWSEIENRLVLESYEIVPYGPNECSGKKRHFKNGMWFPTSYQLKKLLGLKFTGKVCADNYHECLDKLNPLMDLGTSVVIGNKVHTK